ncbi:MAG TPA: methyltransferase domain-containing protein [Longimicrobiales bacterium]
MSASQRTHPDFPWWVAYTFDNPLRRLVHDPARILNGLLKRGDTAVDIGCGLGFFTVAMAKLVGAGGRVIAVDIRSEMLERTRRRVERRGLADRVTLHQVEPDRLNITGPVDFALAFWMVHEAPDRRALLSQVRSILRPTGHLLIAEPKGHVGPRLFEKITTLARDVGFGVREGPHVRLSRSIVCSPGP